MIVIHMEDITLLEVELSMYRKGSVKVQFDLVHGLLRWRESNRWNRNFTRSLNQNDVDQLMRMIEVCSVLNWRAFYPNQETVQAGGIYHQSWTLSIYTDQSEPSMHLEGKDAYPPEFSLMTNILTRIIRQPFKVLD